MKHVIMQPKRLIFGLLLVAGSLFLSACAIRPIQSAFGEPNLVTEEMDFEDFDAVEVNDAFAVQIRQGDEFRVTVEVDEISASYLRVTQRGNTVEIGLRPRAGIFFWLANPVMRAEIIMPSLSAIAANDASRVEVSGFRSDAEARFEVSDASTLEGEVDTGDAWFAASDASRIVLDGNHLDVEIEARDASRVTLHGAGRNASIVAADASHVDLADFPVHDARIEAEDASSVTVDAAGKLDVEASDASHVSYYGEPAMGDISTSDGSSLEARER